MWNFIFPINALNCKIEFIDRIKCKAVANGTVISIIPKILFGKKLFVEKEYVETNSSFTYPFR